MFHGRAGEAASTVLRFRSRPRVTVLHGAVRSAWDGRDLRLDYVHRGLIEVAISGGGRPRVLLVIADEASTATLWRPGSGARARPRARTLGRRVRGHRDAAGRHAWT